MARFLVRYQTEIAETENQTEKKLLKSRKSKLSELRSFHFPSKCLLHAQIALKIFPIIFEHFTVSSEVQIIEPFGRSR